MSKQGHIVELERKHADLEKAIINVKNHPSHEPEELVDLKRKKLKIKDELIKLKEQVTLQ